MTLQNFLQHIKHRGADSVRYFVDWQFLEESATLCLIIEHCLSYSAKYFAKSYFCDVTKAQNAGLSMVRSQTD